MQILGVEIRIVCANENCLLYHLTEDHKVICPFCFYFLKIDASNLIEQIDKLKREAKAKEKTLLMVEVKGTFIRKIFYDETYGKKIP